MNFSITPTHPLFSILSQQRLGPIGQSNMMAGSFGLQSFNTAAPMGYQGFGGGFTQPASMASNLMQQVLKLILLKKLIDTIRQNREAKKPAPIVVDDRTAGKEIGDINFRNLSTEERTNMGNLSDRERAVLHLWGRQMIGKGFQDGGILLTATENANDGSVVKGNAEVQLAQELIDKDKDRFGNITGRSLDEEFFKVFQKITGKDISAKYKDAPMHVASGPTRLPAGLGVDTPEWETALEKQSGLNRFENNVLRLWGHNPLFTGKIDGSILAFTMSNPNALDKGMDKSDVDALLKADMAADGVLNGDSLDSSFTDVMDKLYLGKQGASVERTNTEATDRATQLKRTAEQIKKDTTTGVTDAIQSVGKLFKDHPIISGLGAGSLMAAIAICPFLVGLGAGGAGIALAQKFLDNNK